MMIIATLISLILILMTVCIHYCDLRYIARLADRWDTSNHIVPITEALARFMMLTWSATFFYSTAGQFLNNEGDNQ